MVVNEAVSATAQGAGRGRRAPQEPEELQEEEGDWPGSRVTVFMDSLRVLSVQQ